MWGKKAKSAPTKKCFSQYFISGIFLPHNPPDVWRWGLANDEKVFIVASPHVLTSCQDDKPESEGTHLVGNVKLPGSVKVEDCVERPRVPEDHNKSGWGKIILGKWQKVCGICFSTSVFPWEKWKAEVILQKVPSTFAQKRLKYSHRMFDTIDGALKQVILVFQSRS